MESVPKRLSSESKYRSPTVELMFAIVLSGHLGRGRTRMDSDEEFSPTDGGTAEVDRFPLTGGWNRGTGLTTSARPAVPSAEGISISLDIVDPPADTNPPRLGTVSNPAVIDIENDTLGPLELPAAVGVLTGLETLVPPAVPDRTPFTF